MLDQFQVQDVPMHSVLPLPEETPLAHALAQCLSLGPVHIAVKSGWDEIIGVVPCDTLKRLAARVPEVPLKLVPLEQVRCVPATERLSETVRNLADSDVRILLVETEDRVLLGALSRDELSEITDWAPLRKARKARTGKSIEGLPMVTSVPPSPP